MSTKWTAEEIVAMADEMGLRLVAGLGFWNPLKQCGCACAVLMLKAKPELWGVEIWKHTPVTKYWSLTSLTNHEFSGLSGGFEQWEPWATGPPEYHAHYGLGSEVRRLTDARAGRGEGE